jgi:hypothetical protein
VIAIPRIDEDTGRLNTEKELDPDFVDFNSINRRYHLPWRFYLPFRGVLGQLDLFVLLSRAIAPFQRYAYAKSLPIALFLTSAISCIQATDPSISNSVSLTRRTITACFRGDADCLERLLMQGGDVNARYGNIDKQALPSSEFDDRMHHFSLTSWTALMASADASIAPVVPNGHIKCAQLLLKAGALPNLTDDRGSPALHYGISSSTHSGSSEAETIVLLLLEGGGSPTILERRSIDGPTRVSSLHLAVLNAKLVDALLKKGAHVNIQDSEGSTPLHWAVVARKSQSVELLLEAGADIKIRDKAGHRAIDYVIPPIGEIRRLHPAYSDAECAKVLELIESNLMTPDERKILSILRKAERK